MTTYSSYPFSGQQPGGLNSNIFRPPLTPGTSHVEPISFAATPSQDRPLLTRKRTRTDSIKANSSAPLSCASKDAWTLRPTSPAPLANEHYTLDYKFDTPTLAASSRHDFDLAGERDFRSKWDTANTSPDQDAAGPGLLARERNGKGRRVSYTSLNDQPQTNGWGRFVINLVGGVAGKMWHFCRTSAFSGFYAGSGQGFDFAQPTRLPTPLPGEYPSSDFFGDFEQDNTPIRSLKRQHTESGWVMVDPNPEAPRSTRKTSSGDLTHLGATRASSRRALSSITRRVPSRQTSYTGSPQATTSRLDIFSQAFADRTPSTATTASTRRSSIPRPTAATHHLSAASPSRASFGSPRNSVGGSENLSPDAQRFLSRKERQDRDAEKSMRKMSRQVQELIRQGQAALGTKFDVEVDDFEADDGEDWEDASRNVAR